MTNTGRQTRQKLREPLQRAQWLYLLLLLFFFHTAANALHVTNGVLFLPKALWSLIRLTSFFPNTCFLYLPWDVIRM
jgi:hypothetical protein